MGTRIGLLKIPVLNLVLCLVVYTCFVFYCIIAENFNRLSRAYERYRQTTDGRPMTYSEHELEFTFAKNC